MKHVRQEVISRYTQLVEFCAKVSHRGEDMMTFGERNAFFYLGKYILIHDTGRLVRFASVFSKTEYNLVLLFTIMS